MHRIGPGGAPTVECPGSVAAPEARPGSLCVYEQVLTNSRGIATGGASRYGWIADIWALLGSEEAVSFGTWAVTAP